MHSESSTNDAFLWEQFQKGDTESLGRLMTRHYALLLHYGTRFNRNTDFIRDCLQDIFVELWQRRATLSPLTAAQVKPYLMAMLRRRLHREYLDRQRFDFRGLSEETDFDLFDSAFTAEQELIETETLHETNTRLRQLLNGLPARAKEAVYLRYYDNLDRPAIAQIMGISEQSVSNLFQEAFRFLRRHARAEHFWFGLLAYFTF